MKTLVYIIRHGESTGNRDIRFLGHTDGALTERGERQAMLAGDYLRKIGLRPDAVYASDLSRAYKTAALATAGLWDAPIPERGFREICAGEWEGMYVPDIEKDYGEDLAVWRNTIGLSRPTGGESVAELSARVLDTLFEKAAAHPGGTVFIGTHATPLRVIETYSRGLPVSEMHRVPWANNASLSAYLVEGRTVTPLFYSFDGYLSSLSTACTALL